MKTENEKAGLNLQLQGDRAVVFTRYFDGPSQMVFDCHTKPELVRRWLTGPEDWSFSTCDIELKVGGKYLYIWEHPEQGSFGMHGSFREIAAPNRIVSTESFIPDVSAFATGSPDPEDAAINTLVFEPKGTGTWMTLTVLYPSGTVRETVLKTGMESGMGASYLRLDAMLSTQR